MYEKGDGDAKVVLEAFPKEGIDAE